MSKLKAWGLHYAIMPARGPDLWSRKFENPWKELLPKKDALTLREIVNALQWGARIDALTPEIKSALEQVHREYSRGKPE